MNGPLSHRVFSQPKSWIQSMHTHLLYQDFSNRIVPYRHDSEPYQLSSEGIAPYLLEECLTLGHRGWQLDGFVRGVASSLLTRHEVWLEVSLGAEGEGQKPFRVYEVDGIRRTSTGRLLQAPPSREDLPDGASWDDSQRRDTELDPKRMVDVALPDSYPSELLAQVIQDLAEVDPGLPPNWAMEQMTGQRQDAPRFDVSRAQRTERLRLAQAALPIGWTAREFVLAPNTYTTEYYQAWRELRFLHFRSSMRRCAEEALRRVLAIAAAECGFRVSVMAQGLYTPDEVQEFVRQFEDGEISLSRVSDIHFEKATDHQVEPRRVV